MADSNTYFNIVRFSPSGGGDGAALLLDAPWKLTTGLRSDINRAIVSYTEFDKLGPIGGKGSILFCYNDDSSGDLTLKDITLLDVEVVEYGIPQGEDAPRAVKYRAVFADKRYQFEEPRGGRLIQGIVNPSNSAANNDPAIVNKLGLQTLSSLIQFCLTAMGVTASLPSISQDPPENLKWFGTHAPTELARLLAYANCVFLLQPDGSFEIQRLGDGDDPEIENALPAISLEGADGRGKTVVFTSFPTQVALVLSVNDLQEGDLQYVGRNTSGTWIPYTTLYGSTTVVSTMPLADDWQAKRERFTHVRLNPNTYNPLVSPILNRTWQLPALGVTSGDLPPQMPLQFTCPFMTWNNTAQVWGNFTVGDTIIPIDRVEDGNVITFSRQLLKVNVTSAPGYPDDGIYSYVTAADLDHEVSLLNIAVGKSNWDRAHGCFVPAYFYVGFSGTAESNTKLSGADAEAAMNQADTIVVSMPDLQAVQFGLTDADDEPNDIFNKTILEDRCQKLAPRLLKGAATPPRVLAGVGFFNFTFNGKISEVEIDQQAAMMRFKVDSFFRPAGSYLAAEFHRLRNIHESHPHEAKTQGSRHAQGYASSGTIAQPLQPMAPDPPLASNVRPQVLQITSSSGSGKYYGALYTGACTGVSGSTLSGMTPAGGVIVVNGPEVGSSGAPYLNNNAFVLGLLIGIDATTTQPIYIVSACSLGSC